MNLLIEQFTIWDFDMNAAMEYRRIRTELRQRGRPVPSIDARIAAIARANNLVLLTSDTRHFPQVQGLTIEDWLTMEGDET